MPKHSGNNGQPVFVRSIDKSEGAYNPIDGQRMSHRCVKFTDGGTLAISGNALMIVLPNSGPVVMIWPGCSQALMPVSNEEFACRAANLYIKFRDNNIGEDISAKIERDWIADINDYPELRDYL